MTNSFPTLGSADTPPSMQEIAFQTIKLAIMRKELLPGTIYSEQAVAKEMGMSKTPAHQALLDLSNKGFVSLLPRKGFKVNVLSARNISNMFELRRALEHAVILKITPRLSAESIQELEKIIEEIKQTLDPIDFQKHDRTFHRYLASLSNNTYFINALNTVWDLSDWVGASILHKRGGYNQVASEHMAIFEFLTVGNAEKAAAAMERHLISTESRFLKGLENNGV